MKVHCNSEVCELVEFYLINKLTPLVGTKDVELYWNDDSAVIYQANSPKMNKTKKEITALFKSERLSIIINKNVIETDILDVSFNLEIDIFFLIESQKTPLYISILSQTIYHPLPNNCHQWLTDVCNVYESNKAKSLYSVFKKQFSYVQYEIRSACWKH